MNYAEIKNCDIANGPGVRISLFVSGCTHRCKGCFNRIAWDFNYGTPFTEETVENILKMLQPDYIAGLTLLGGEPFEPENQKGLLKLVQLVKQKFPGKSIWAFSGYLFDRDILSGRLGDPDVTKAFLQCVDVLVDGPFVEAEKDLMLRFRGSRNQRLIDVPASLEQGRVVLWKDWQSDERS
jgi:anaerobic ribonucleoside-triphosphate reductase activating protein